LPSSLCLGQFGALHKAVDNAPRLVFDRRCQRLSSVNHRAPSSRCLRAVGRSGACCVRRGGQSGTSGSRRKALPQRGRSSATQAVRGPEARSPRPQAPAAAQGRLDIGLCIAAPRAVSDKKSHDSILDQELVVRGEGDIRVFQARTMPRAPTCMPCNWRVGFSRSHAFESRRPQQGMAFVRAQRGGPSGISPGHVDRQPRCVMSLLMVNLPRREAMWQSRWRFGPAENQR